MVRTAELVALKREKQGRNPALLRFISNIEVGGETLEEFDEQLWALARDKVVVMPEGRLMVSFSHVAEISQ